MTDLLSRLAAQGIRLTADGDRLGVIAPRGLITAELCDELTTVKPALLTELRHSLVLTLRTAAPSTT